jgi:sugar lactone lactonase YvrE
MMQRHKYRYLGILAALTLAVIAFGSIVRADPPGSPSFNRTWERTDKPVADLTISRTWMWGPKAFTAPLVENYVEAPGGMRLVQYFDKSRMEDNSYRGSEPWDVTNGLLVVELMTGQRQIGDNQWEERLPAQINVGGDADDPTGPTYAVMAQLRADPALGDGQLITWTIDRSGIVGQAPEEVVNLGIATAYHVQEPGLDHQIASVFWNFMNSSGPIWEDGQLIEDQLFLNPFYATGFPVTEPYWANIKVGGVYRWVLLQCFERRCLTYNPDNLQGWQVEAGNVGMHYYDWLTSSPPATPTPTATPTSTSTPTMTASVTVSVIETFTATSTSTSMATVTPTVSPTPSATPGPPATPEFEFAWSFGEPWDLTTLMNGPQGIAVKGSTSMIYVADTNNHRIQLYSYQGRFIKQWGSNGTADGQFNGPQGMAIDNEGRLWVADTGNSRIQIFNDDGQHLKTITHISVGGQIPTIHTLWQPRDIAFDSSGTAWIVDDGLNQLVRVRYDGSQGGVFSGPGPAEQGGLIGPTGIGIDSGGIIWVTDSAGWVSRFNSTGGFVDLQAGFVFSPTDIAFDSSGSFYITDGGTNVIFKGSPGQPNPLGVWGTPGANRGEFNTPMKIVTGSGGDLLIADTGNNRIQKFSSSGDALDLWSDNRRGRFAFPSGIEWDKGSASTGPGVRIADTLLSRIVVGYDDYLFEWGTGTTVESGDPALLFPLDLAMDAAYAYTYVADTGNHRIVKYQGYGQFVKEWGTFGTGPGQFDTPLSVATDASGNVYVADAGNHRIQKFNSDGQFIKQWGGHGNLLGAFDAPSGLAIAGNFIYVVDQGNSRIQRFDLNGVFTGVSWGSGGSGEGQFSTPADIEVGPDGNVYVADSGNHRIQSFTPDGEFLRQWGSGPGSGSKQFDSPVDIAFDRATGKTMYVTDRNNHRIQVLVIP